MAAFQDKVVWLTGASSGIGEALALAFSAAGAQLVISARRENELERVKNACAHPEKVMVLPLDLADSSNFTALTDQVIAAFSRIDILVNNGGLSQRSEAAETPLEIDRKIMEINYFGNVALTKAVLPHMQKRKAGHIVVISSIAGKFGFFLRSAYSASKHALHGFYESMRLEEEKNNLLVTLVCPGRVRTAISMNALDIDGQAHEALDAGQAEGITAEACAQAILTGIEKGKLEILVGGKELKAVKVKRLFPKLFHKLIRKQSPTG